jgi:hypothetical protein
LKISKILDNITIRRILKPYLFIFWQGNTIPNIGSLDIELSQSLSNSYNSNKNEYKYLNKEENDEISMKHAIFNVVKRGVSNSLSLFIECMGPRQGGQPTLFVNQTTPDTAAKSNMKYVFGRPIGSLFFYSENVQYFHSTT